ncbi:MAG TPA: Crp/Fnr family transcriptional regulator [Gemmatimonadaceae bacterium]|nr:Crp/Fnr family transcriptional regulator [Gemmatimonadaceae bacterium]
MTRLPMLKILDPALATVAPSIRNRLLAELAPDDLARVAPYLESVELEFGLVLHEPNARIQYVYFPTTGAVSMMVVSPDGAVEVGSVGNEGFAGIAALLHADFLPTRALVQAPGQAYRMKVPVFRMLITESDTMQQLFSRYTLAFLNQVAQSVACNRLHSLESRCARWLLMTHDRIDGDQIRLTHESLSYMLGVHRPAVTLAAGVLQKAGFIDYTRGLIKITNRPGLEGAACACYQIMRRGYDDLLQSGQAVAGAATFSSERREHVPSAADSAPS